MIDKKAVRKRMNTALDKYADYAPLISKKGDLVRIPKQETYWVNIQKLTCTCEDFRRHGANTPCKHIFMSVLWQNSKNHDE